MKREKERAEILGEYIAATGATVRRAAEEFRLSKSTVHKDVSERLYYINPRLYKEVKEVLKTNLSERHIRGGEATRKKYLDEKKSRG